MEYITHAELAQRLKHSQGYLHCVRDNQLAEGVHYIQPFGSRKYLYIWERVEAVMLEYHTH